MRGTWPRFLWAGALVAVLSACAALMGVEDGILEDRLRSDASVDAVGDVVVDTAPPPVEVCADCLNEQADETKGVFVSVAAANPDPTCGSKLEPCNGINR